MRAEMAMALAAMLTQNLLPQSERRPRAAAELLMVGYGARQHIRKNALAASASGDHDHAQAGFIHSGRIAGAACLPASPQP